MPKCNFMICYGANAKINKKARFKLILHINLNFCENFCTYSENSPQIHAAAYRTSHIPFRWELFANRWAFSRRIAICDTANGRIAFTRIATSNICEAINWPCRVPSIRVNSTRILTYLTKKESTRELISHSLTVPVIRELIKTSKGS